MDNYEPSSLAHRAVAFLGALCIALELGLGLDNNNKLKHLVSWTKYSCDGVLLRKVHTVAHTMDYNIFVGMHDLKAQS